MWYWAVFAKLTCTGRWQNNSDRSSLTTVDMQISKYNVISGYARKLVVKIWFMVFNDTFNNISAISSLSPKSSGRNCSVIFRYKSIWRKQLNITIMFPFCNLFKVHYNTGQGYVRLANWQKEKTKNCLQWIKVVEKNPTAHSQYILHVDVLYNIKRKKYQTVCAELTFAKSPSTEWSWFCIELVIFYLYLLCSWIIAIFKECLIKSRDSHCLYRYQVTLIVLD